MKSGDIVFVKFFNDLPHYTYMCYGTDDNYYSYYVCLDYHYCENIQMIKGVGIPYKIRTQEKRTILNETEVEVIDDEDMKRMEEMDPLMEKLKCGCCSNDE